MWLLENFGEVNLFMKNGFDIEHKIRQLKNDDPLKIRPDIGRLMRILSRRKYFCYFTVIKYTLLDRYIVFNFKHPKASWISIAQFSRGL